jgi:hypothetical protein
MARQVFAAGGCRCGAVSVEIYGKPRMMVQCHCLDCQKFSGTGHTSNAYFAKSDVKIQGETREFSVMADSGAEMTRSFCPMCGSRLFGTNSERPDLVSITVGCLEDQGWFKPQMVLYTSRQHDWDITSDEIEQFDTMPMT